MTTELRAVSEPVRSCLGEAHAQLPCGGNEAQLGVTEADVLNASNRWASTMGWLM